MKKTFNINIVGFPFVIDEDAFNLLSNYLNTIEHAFRNVDGSSELVNDIEARIAELLLECTGQGQAIITLTDVEQVIARVGKPEEFVEEASFTVEDKNGDSQTIDVETEKVTPPPYIPPLPNPQKRLYRDPQNAMLGGVCSGLAWYIGWDVTWVRLLIVALTICSYSVMAIVYLVLWIVVPEARTPLQRMQMMGEKPTMENIGKTVTDTFKEEQGTTFNTQPTSAPATAGFMANTFSLVAKIMIIIGLIIGIPILFGLAIGLLGCIFFMIMWGGALLFGSGLPFDAEEFSDPFVRKIVFWGVLCGIGWIITLALPLFYIIRKGLHYTPLSKQVRRFLNVLWVIGFFLAALSTGMVVTNAYYQDDYFQSKNHCYEHQARRHAKSAGVTITESDDETIIEDSINASVEEIVSGADVRTEKINEAVERINDKAEEISSQMEKIADTITSSSASKIRVP